MSAPTNGIAAAGRLLEAGKEREALQMLHELLGATHDSTLRHEIHLLAERAHESSHGFHKIEWHRLMIETESGS